ncbi:MAG: hypothetical protein DRJ01_08860 [Bacteroidetes bacterium]|nr:MAG: hypothetical protein DRJ01_08860 [Bacteroidota bacterium]
MQKLLEIKEQHKISYQDIAEQIASMWETTTSSSNVHRILTDKSDCEVYTLFKIISAINMIFKKRGLSIRVTPNDVLDYEDYLFEN